jgi:hypothetical protein
VLFCWHKWSGPAWQFTGMDSYYWYRRCLKCGTVRKLKQAVSPPSHFVNGREEIISDADYQNAMRQMRDAW